MRQILKREVVLSKDRELTIVTLSSNRYWAGYVVLFTDKLGRKWESGAIKISRELINDFTKSELKTLICEIANERIDIGIKNNQ